MTSGIATLAALRLEEMLADEDDGELVEARVTRDEGRACALVRVSERCRAGEPEGLDRVVLRVQSAPRVDVELLFAEEAQPRELMLRSQGGPPLLHVLLSGLELLGAPLAVENASPSWALLHGPAGAPAVPLAPGAQALLEVEAGALQALHL